MPTIGTATDLRAALGNLHPGQSRTSLQNGEVDESKLFGNLPKEIPKNQLYLPSLNELFKWFNGRLEAKDKNNKTFFEKTNGLLLKGVKALWPLHIPFQLVGLVDERFNKLARAVYGACWSIVYSVYRPWKNDRAKLTYQADKEIPGFWKNFDNFNEHFRVGMGSLVSLLYGGGAFGMLWSWLKGDDDGFEKSAEVYKTGMFNQNQVFASMNAAIELRRRFSKGQLLEGDRQTDNVKSKVELIDAALFIPNIFTRALDTLKLFGLNLMNDGMERFVNFLSYFSYGTWAARFGNVKTLEVEGGDLEPQTIGKVDKALHDTQKYSGKIFYTLLPGLSWVAAAGELFGLREFAETAFKLEGICERLLPTISSWCIRDTWLKAFGCSHDKGK